MVKMNSLPLQRSRLLVLLQLLLTLTTIHTVTSYPVIAHIDEETERCFRFNVRDHDEAHLMIAVLPNEEQYEKAKGNDVELEEWYIKSMFEMSKQKDKKGLPSQLAPEVPESISAKQNEFQHLASPIMVRLTDNPSASTPIFKGNFRPKYFVPLVVNHLKKYMRGIVLPKKDGQHPQQVPENLEGYGLCFKNDNTEHHMLVLFEVVLDSEQLDGEGGGGGAKADATTNSTTGADKAKKTDFDKQKHLTPLERSLDQSINAAHSVLREMKNMEKREQRMRQTADNITERLRYFSYLSIGVLLVVTYIQVGYLKRYFHKKKLL